ncbi:unnamed protein product [Scytosiphon promiscuus]
MRAARGDSVRRASVVIRTARAIRLLAPILLVQGVHAAAQLAPPRLLSQQHPNLHPTPSGTTTPTPSPSGQYHPQPGSTVSSEGLPWSSRLGARLAVSNRCDRLSFVSTVRSCALRPLRHQEHLRTRRRRRSSRRVHHINDSAPQEQGKPAAGACTFVMGASSSRSSSLSSHQRSALIGGADDSKKGSVGLKSGYGAAPSTTLLRGAASPLGELDPEDPSFAAGGLGAEDDDEPDSGGHGGDEDGDALAEADEAKKSKNEGLTGQILSLAVPALVALSVDPLMSAVDTAYIGRLGAGLGGGEIGLGALALNTSIFTFSFYIFGFLATVPTPFVASARAKGDNAGAARLVGQLLTAALALGLTLMAFLEFFGPEMLHLLGATEVNEDQALLFLRTRAISAPAVLMMTVGNGAFRGFLDTKTPLLIGLGANLVNFVLDPLLIFKLGMGLQGAAIATVSAEWSGAAAFLIVLAMKDPTIRLRKVSLPKSREGWEEGKAVLTSSAAVFGRTVALQAALGIACAFAARVGPSSVAAHQVASQLYILLAFASDSLAVAVQCLVADRLGAGLITDAREVAGRVLLFSLAWGLGLLILFQVFGDVLPLIFTSNREVLTAIAPVIAVVGLLQPLNAFVFVGDGILQGTQDFVYEALTMAVSASLLPGYVWLHGYLGGGETTLLDVWVGLVMMQCCRSLTFTFRHFLDPKGPLAAP